MEWFFNIFLNIISYIILFISLIFLIFVIFLRYRRYSDIDLKKIFSEELYSYEEDKIKNIIRNYLSPQCQTKNPHLRTQTKKYDCQQIVDEFIKTDRDNKFLLLVGDAGIGKTTFLINYFTDFKVKKNNKLRIVLLNVDTPNIISKIKEIETPFSTVLLLDGLKDEYCFDFDLKQQFHELLYESSKCYKIIITSRSTCYYPKLIINKQLELSEFSETLHEIKIMKSGPRDIGEKPEYGFLLYYFCPFEVTDINRFVSKAISKLSNIEVENTLSKLKALETHFSSYPMIFTSSYFLDILKTENSILIIYEKIIDAVIERELLSNESKNRVIDFFINIAKEMLKKKCSTLPLCIISEIASELKFKYESWLSGKFFLFIDTNNECRFTNEIFKDIFISKYILKNGKNNLDFELTDNIKMLINS